MPLTDEEIDQLEGHRLQIAVAESLGWKWVDRIGDNPYGWLVPKDWPLHPAHRKCPVGDFELIERPLKPRSDSVSGYEAGEAHNWHADNGEAVGLLLGCNDWFSVDDRPVGHGEPVCYIEIGCSADSEGKTFPIAACRAFLKLQNKVATT